MSAEDLARGCGQSTRRSVRQKVAAGDLAAAGDLDLTDEEAGLLRGAADDYPEVAGFFFDVFIQARGFRRRFLRRRGWQGAREVGQPGYSQALQYLRRGKI